MIELVGPPGAKQTLKNFVPQMLQYYPISFEWLDTIGTKGCWLNFLTVLYQNEIKPEILHTFSTWKKMTQTEN